MSLSRRSILQSAWIPFCGLAAAQTNLSTRAGEPKEIAPLNRFPRMMQDFFTHHVRDIEQRAIIRRRELKTKEDAESYIHDVQHKIRLCFGAEPARTPLNPRVTEVIERDGYRIENVIYESRPGFPVTANLYVPTKHKGKRPAVVGTCGHSTNGKAAEAYQSFAQGLVRKGYVCLVYDPIGQGERLQYVDENFKSRHGVGVREHLLAGNQQFLVGEFIGMWRAWDGIRSLDYLMTRPEVDRQHIGVTGNSGGGTMTTWLCGVERRWTMAAPSCFVTTFRRNLENELPADTEQCPPRALSLDLDHADFLAAMAPRPIIILAKERDFFDVRGSQEAYQRLRKIYGLLGHESQVGLFIGPTYHGFSQENREAMYGWFNRASGQESGGKEDSLIIEKDETLWCTPNGQVAALKGTRSVFQFTRDRAVELARQAGNPRGEELRSRVRAILKLPASTEFKQPPDYRIWRYLGSRDYPAKNAIAYSVRTEPHIEAVSYFLSDERIYSRPPRLGEKAVLYVSHLSSDTELRDEQLIKSSQSSTGSRILHL